MTDRPREYYCHHADNWVSEPEAAPPRATTPRICDRCGKEARPDWDSTRCEWCVPGRLRSSLSAAPSEEIGGRDALGRDWLDRGLDTLIIAIHRKGDDHILPGPARLLLENEIRQRLAVDAREAERLRAIEKAATKILASYDEGYVGAHTNYSHRSFEELRASLRATPPETTTQEECCKHSPEFHHVRGDYKVCSVFGCPCIHLTGEPK